MMKDVEGVMRKRNLIAKTRKTVIFWVCGASAILGIMSVGVYLVAQNIAFSYKIIGMKQDTIATLENNIKVAPSLKGELGVLNVNSELRRVAVNSDAKPLQTILDALPADENRLALGASLQQKLLSGVPGLVVNSLSVDPSAGSGQVVAENQLEGGVQEMVFTAAISGDENALKAALQRLEKSIRAINVKSVNASASGDNISLQITGAAYYLPPPNLELAKKEVSQSKSSPKKNKTNTSKSKEN